MSWKHRDAKQEARLVRRDAEGTPYDQMVVDFAHGWHYVIAPVQPTPGTVGGWVHFTIQPWTAGYLLAQGATYAREGH